MNIAIILSGGTGTRLGSNIPKQYLEVGSKPVIFYCLKTFIESHKIDRLQIVAEQEWRPMIAECLKEIGNEIVESFSTPGETRQLSIWNALSDMKGQVADQDIVIIHDAARPLVSIETISDCFQACQEADGAIPVLPVKDTTYYCKDGKIESLLDRDKLFGGQAPEAFLYGKYYHANERLFPTQIYQIKGSTEPAVLAGMNVMCVAGDERNFKITTREDLSRFEQILKKEDK